MFIEQIFTKGVYNVGVDNNDINFESYRLAYDPISGSFTINIATALQRVFPGRDDKEKEANQKAKKAELATKLINELRKNYRLENGTDFTIDVTTNSNLKITAQGANRMRNELSISLSPAHLTLAELSYSLFLIPYLHKGDLNLLKNSFATMLKTGMGLLGYVNNVPDADRGVPHVFYIGQQVRVPQGQLLGLDTISDHIAQMLRDAFRVAIARLLGRDTKSYRGFISANTFSGNLGRPHHGISFEISNADLNELSKQVNIRPQEIKSFKAKQETAPADRKFHVSMASAPAAAQAKQIATSTIAANGGGVSLPPRPITDQQRRSPLRTQQPSPPRQFIFYKGSPILDADEYKTHCQTTWHIDPAKTFLIFPSNISLQHHGMQLYTVVKLVVD